VKLWSFRKGEQVSIRLPTDGQELTRPKSDEKSAEERKTSSLYKTKDWKRRGKGKEDAVKFAK